MSVPSDVCGPTLLAITASLTAFNEFLPKLTDIRAHTPYDACYVQDVRLGELSATALVLGIGAISSSLTGHPAPVIVAGLACIGLIGIYEMSLRSIPHA